MNTDGHRKVRIGVSACLLGQEVRFDGGHKRDHFLMDVLGPHVTWVPVCPEVEIGLGAPRETLRLVRLEGTLRMMTTKTGVDHTDCIEEYHKGLVPLVVRLTLIRHVRVHTVEYLAGQTYLEPHPRELMLRNHV